MSDTTGSGPSRRMMTKAKAIETLQRRAAHLEKITKARKSYSAGDYDRAEIQALRLAVTALEEAIRWEIDLNRRVP